MYQPKFEINNQILNNIAQIEAARAIIDAAPLIPAYEKQFKTEAIIKQVHYATKLEGNDLSFNQVAKIIEGEKISSGDRDVQEVINYRKVVRYLEELVSLHQEKLPLPGEKITPEEKMAQSSPPFLYTEQMLKRIHEIIVEKIIPENQAGEFRKVQVVLQNTRTGETIFRPPPAVEVPYLVEDFLKWLNSDKATTLHPVIKSGIIHYILVAIHPFVEGNGRTARALSTLALIVEGYDIKGLFALEEYFDNHAREYYGSLQAVSSQKEPISQKNLTDWLEFFTKALMVELNRIKEKVERLSTDIKLKQRLGGKQVPLTERQVKLIEYMQEFGGLRMSDAKEILPMVSEDTIWRDLKKLIEQKIVHKKGSTKGAYYALVQ
jgi:Fic family protein